MLERKKMIDKSKIYMQHDSSLQHDKQQNMTAV